MTTDFAPEQIAALAGELGLTSLTVADAIERGCLRAAIVARVPEVCAALEIETETEKETGL